MQSVRYERSSAGLLAQEPPFTDEPEPSEPKWWPTLYAHNEGRLQGMRAWRYSWWLHWGQLARLILPYRYKWVITSNTMNRGSSVNDAIVNETATLAMRVCAAGMLSGLMSPSRPWFRLGVPISSYEPDAEAKRWLDDTAERIYGVLSGSNFYTEGAQMYQDVSTFGTSPMLIYEDKEDVIRCYVASAGEYFLASSARLTVDTFYREYTYTVSQIVDQFGLNACPEVVRNAWRNAGASIEAEYVICHAIEPNFALADRGNGGKPISPLPGKFTWRETYWLRGMPTPAPLSMRGFNERPFIVMRWSKTANDPYGRGPGMDALGGTAQLQHEEVRKAEYIDKFVRPPMVGDVSLKNQPSSIRSGDITFVNGANGKQQFYPAFEVNPAGMAPLVQDIERIEARINRAFFTDVFMMISQMEGVQPRNELELAMRQGEKIQLLGPVIEAAESELSLAIARVVSIMTRRGMIEPMPQSMRGLPVTIRYVSLMKMAQNSAKTAGMEQTLKFMGAASQASLAAGLPDPLRVAKLDEFARDYADAVGTAERLFYSPDEVAAMDQAKAKQAQQQQLMAAVPGAVQAAQGLSQIDVGGGVNAVQAMINGPQQ